MRNEETVYLQSLHYKSTGDVLVGHRLSVDVHDVVADL